MQKPEINKCDHNYSESKSSQHAGNDAALNTTIHCNAAMNNCSIINKGSKATSVIGQIRDIDELKKIAPRVRLQDAKSLNELTRISSLSNNGSKLQGRKLSISEKTRQELMKYCRTCAGLKLPLVSFSLYCMHLKDLYFN